MRAVRFGYVAALVVALLALFFTGCARTNPQHAEQIAKACGDDVPLGDHELEQTVAFLRAYEVDCHNGTATLRSESAADRYERGTGVQP